MTHSRWSLWTKFGCSLKGQLACVASATLTETSEMTRSWREHASTQSTPWWILGEEGEAERFQGCSASWSATAACDEHVSLAFSHVGNTYCVDVASVPPLLSTAAVWWIPLTVKLHIHSGYYYHNVTVNFPATQKARRWLWAGWYGRAHRVETAANTKLKVTCLIKGNN